MYRFTVTTHGFGWPAQAPSQGEESHLLIEGYKPTFGTGGTGKLGDEGADSEEDAASGDNSRASLNSGSGDCFHFDSTFS